MLRRNLLVTYTTHPETFAKNLVGALSASGRSIVGIKCDDISILPSASDLEVSIWVGKAQAWAIFIGDNFTQTELRLLARGCVELEPDGVLRGFSLNAEIDEDEPRCTVYDCAFEVTKEALRDLESPNQAISSEKTDHYDDVCDDALQLAVDAWIDASNQRAGRRVSILQVGAARSPGPRLT